MNITHPLEQLTTKNLWFVFGVALLIFSAVIWKYKLIRDDVPGMGPGAEHLLNLCQAYPEKMKRWVLFDYWFMPAYVALGIAIAVLGSRSFEAGSWWHQAGIAIAWLFLLQWVIDGLENYFMLQFFKPQPERYLIWVKVFSLLKKPIIAAGLLYGLWAALKACFFK